MAEEIEDEFEGVSEDCRQAVSHDQSHKDQKRKEGIEKAPRERQGQRAQKRKGRRHSEERSERHQSMSFTALEVDQLIEESARLAFEVEGRTGKATSSVSQLSPTFHKQVQIKIQQFFKANGLEVRLGQLGSLLNELLDLCTNDANCRPKSNAGSMDIFPLPAARSHEWLPKADEFLQPLLKALNSLSGHEETTPEAGNKTACRVVKRLAVAMKRSGVLEESLPMLDFKELFSSRGVDYEGEEIKLARPLKWKSLEPALPAEVGKLDIRDFADAGTLHFIDNFESYLLPESDQTIGKAPRVMVAPEDWLEVARGLILHGICEPIRASDVHHVGEELLLNGMFAVSKQEFSQDVEICRLIMNLKPLNQVSKGLHGDTCTLPTVTNLGGIYLDEDEVLTTSSEDIRCFFYLFRVPKAWRRYMAFGCELPRELIPEDFNGEQAFLTSMVLPMGYLNSVSIAQGIHRGVVRRCLSAMNPPLGGEQELRRDRVFSSSSSLFRVYLDNFDFLRKVDTRLAALIEGSPSEEVLQLREAYLEEGLPRHPKKSVENQCKAEVQGALVDGVQGLVMAKGSKVAKYVKLALEVLSHGSATQRELQVVGGGFVYIAMFRRPLLSGLNQVWRMITEMGDKQVYRRCLLKKEVASELIRFIALTPLAFMDLRAGFDPKVSASDASTTGGGVCVSRGLTPYGLAASSSTVRGDIPEDHDFVQLLSVGLFDGISALRVALDTLGVPVAGHISVEMSPEATRVVESFFPDAIHVSNIEEVSEDMCREWALRFPGVGLIIVGSGPPCQGVSGLNFDRRGALRDSRSSLFKHVPRVVGLLKKVFPWAMVHSLTESVASMDRSDCEAMNQGLEDEPWFIDAHGVSLCHRPRLYWLSWELFESEGVELWFGSTGQLPLKGEVKLQAEVKTEAYVEPGWKLPTSNRLPTFTTSRPSSKPMRRPAGLQTCRPHEVERWTQDQHRYPPYQYRDENVLWNKKGEARPPTVAEREAILGFPIGYTKQCMKKALHGSTLHNDCRLTLLGNSWSVPVIAWMLSKLLELLGFMDPLPLQDLVTRLCPGRAQGLQTLLLRPPLNHSTTTICEGEDILLQSHTDVPVRYHRLRASIPAKLWRWSTVTGWEWKGEPEHINVLELRAALTTIKWRCERLHQMDLRCVHLLDSLVVLHAVTRGRSSSRKMRRSLMKLSAYLLATGLNPMWGYVDTSQNPADKPSRRGVRKRWLKKAWRSMKVSPKQVEKLNEKSLVP